MGGGVCELLDGKSEKKDIENVEAQCQRQR